jgi:hypothetical protein
MVAWLLAGGRLAAESADSWSLRHWAPDKNVFRVGFWVDLPTAVVYCCMPNQRQASA